ncbi:hypothetical protein [Stenotrophomonas oahuensis]|uniref:Lipoprotein n=1 Tax=Stenotrophomonas oahuensis TaxID=3003271 RepID=A0ABY9YSD7_9GAMM|nr:hypothetical protein [Stenotrophomonas sp. A5586]WNH53854.1 hypothetical protein PDM29_06125 [Stenotrophomonas sp. A5586]
MKNLVAPLLCLLLAGCVSTPTQVNLVPTGITRTVRPPMDMQVKLVSVIIADPATQTGKVMLDATFPPVWRDAIQTSLDQAGLFSDDGSRNVTVYAKIRRFEFNPTGFSNTVDVDAVYSVVDRKSGDVVFEKEIVTSATNSASKTFNAQVRVINLWNQATQENIAKFVQALEAMPEPPSAAAAGT